MLGLGTNAATNAAIDASGIKSKAEDTLYANASDIAAQTGMSEEQVNQAIDNLDINNWSVTSLPNDAKETGTQAVNYGGILQKLLPMKILHILRFRLKDKPLRSKFLIVRRTICLF